MSLETLAARAAAAVKAHLVRACPGQVARMIVYGSRARGEARPDSDLDILVLTAGDESDVRRHASDAVFAAYEELDYPFPISAQVMSQAHFDELVRRERLYASEVLRDGVAV